MILRDTAAMVSAFLVLLVAGRQVLLRCTAKTLSGTSGYDGIPVERSQTGSLKKVVFNKMPGLLNGGAVLDVGKPGAFDAAWVTCPSVLFDGKRYRMWYSSVYDSKMGRGGIGLATSADGRHWIRANNGEPVLTVGAAGSLDDGQVMGPEVRCDGQTYYMWYTGMAREWHSSGFGYYRLFLATSLDGIRWTRANRGKPVLDVGSAASCDEVQAATPSIIRQGEGYRMWYAAWSPGNNHTVCVARSLDGVQWERENGGQSVRGLSPSVAFGPAVVRLHDRYLMVYMSSPPAEKSLYAAVSRDGLDWQMTNGGAPILPLGGISDFDSFYIGHGDFLPAGDRLLLWYTGYRREADGVGGLALRIGLAQAPLAAIEQLERGPRAQAPLRLWINPTGGEL